MLNLIIEHSPSEADNKIIRKGINAFNEKIIGEKAKALSIFLKNELAAILGGLIAYMDSNSIYIDTLWIEENQRGKGYGKKLLAEAEKEAIGKGCNFSTVDTLEFQAEPFYLKNGYQRIGVVQNYTFNHARIILRKNLKDKRKLTHNNN